jgi:formamidopyrimidine-DNA glycosylase
MPELPEVETIRRALRDGGRNGPPLVGRRIQTVHLLWERTLATPSPAAFQKQIIGQIFRDVGRRGKFIQLELSLDVLLIHLRMSGDLLVESCDAPLAPHHRLALDLDGGLRLAFNDPRKFGRVWLVSDPMEILGGLGPEPLSLELTAQAFYERLHLHHRQLKPLLLDQSFLAGLGNIYADEALHMARLHPLTVSSKLDQTQAARLLDSIRQVLEDGIQRQGASIDWVYRGGDFQNYFHVYQRTGEACTNCGTPIQRITVGQRGTHFCPACQPSTLNS